MSEEVEGTPQKSAKQREPDYGLTDSSPARKLFDRVMRDARNNAPKKARDKQNWLNTLTYNARHWQIFNRSNNRYEDRGFDIEKGGLPEWVPRPVTNLFKTTIDGIVSLLNASEPAKQATPAKDSEESIAAADVIENALPTLFKEIEYDKLKPELNKSIALMDKCGLFVWYDNDPKHGVDTLQGLKCDECGAVVHPEEAQSDEGDVCPECESPSMSPAFDDQFQPVGQQQPIGKLCAKVIPAFEISQPSSARSAQANKSPWVATHTREPIEDVLRTWPALKDKLKDRQQDYRSGGQDDFSRNYADAMTALSGPGTNDDPLAGLGAQSTQGAPVVHRLWHDPIEDDECYFPGGLFAIMVEDQLVEAGPLPYTDRNGRGIKTLLIRQYAARPNSPWGLPPADDLVPLQYSYNTVDSLIQLIIAHNAAPRVFVPASVTFVNKPTGAPGEYNYYRSVVPGEKPTVAQGLNPPEALFKYLDMIEQRFQKLSRLNSVLAGERPEGDPTLGEVEILQERGMNAFKDPIAQIVEFEMDLATILLHVARQSMWSPRFRAINGDNGQWEVDQFAGADLEGDVDVVIEPSSAWPKSQVMEMIRLKQGFEMGLFAPPMQDPELASKLTNRLHLEDLKPSISEDRKQVARKLDRWKSATMPQEIAPPDQIRENLPYHLLYLTNFLKSELFEKLMDPQHGNPPVAEAMKSHVQQIAMMLAPKPAPVEGEKKGPDGKTLGGLVEKGAIQPAGAGAAPLDQLQQQGVLMPAGAVPKQQLPSVDALVAAQAITPIGTQPPAAPGGAQQ